jgi:IgA Peptidase M64/Peptidase M64 N-terminus
MKATLIISLLLFHTFLFSINAEPKLVFNEYFNDQTMRIDYYHMADKTSEFISIDKTYRQGTWAGNPHKLMDPFNNGKYFIKIYHQKSGKLIFSKGFTSLCAEYMTTDMAAKGIKRTFHESALIPDPKEKIIFTIERRDRKNNLHPIFKQVIDPASVDIITEPLQKDVMVLEFLKNGDSHQKVDLVFIAEGYTESDADKFKKDLKEICTLFFNHEPYKSHQKAFNVYGLFKASQESGTDEPTSNVFKNTAVGSSFNALGLYRYNLTEENKAIRDIAAHVPYDALIIMVNNERYGGGGIYNTYCLFTLDPKKSAYLLIHEFGHSFTGLADEYYSGEVAYNEFYPTDVEPTEANITALLTLNKPKWKALVTKDTPIPTPWQKETYDKMNRTEKKVHRLKPEFKGVVGAFEGAGYSSKGLYRSAIDCIMLSSTMQPYCKVCEEAVIKTIKYYSAR